MCILIFFPSLSMIGFLCSFLATCRQSHRREKFFTPQSLGTLKIKPCALNCTQKQISHQHSWQNRGARDTSCLQVSHVLSRFHPNMFFFLCRSLPYSLSAHWVGATVPAHLLAGSSMSSPCSTMEHNAAHCPQPRLWRSFDGPLSLIPI